MARQTAQQWFEAWKTKNPQRPWGPGTGEVVTITYAEHGDGWCRVRWHATPDFTAHIDVVHGGFVSMLLEVSMGAATLTVLQEHEQFATADLHVQFLRAAKVGMLEARGEVIRRSRRLTFCESEARDEEGNLVAKATATCAIFETQQ